jgi:hypothetical protein
MSNDSISQGILVCSSDFARNAKIGEVSLFPFLVIERLKQLFDFEAGVHMECMNMVPITATEEELANMNEFLRRRFGEAVVIEKSAFGVVELNFSAI